MKDKSDKEIRATAKNAMRLGDTYTALFFYEEWSIRKPENLKIAFQVAELYRATKNYLLAESWYEKIKNADSKGFPLSVFYLAQMQMSNEKYVEAKENLTKFKKLARGLKDRKYRYLTKSGILSCDYALALKDSNSTAVTEHLGNSVNQPHIEFSPIPVDDKTLIYGSLKDDGVNYYDVDLHDSLKVPMRKFYYAVLENDKWVSKGELDGPFNQEGVHIGNGVLSEDGKRMYFTICQKTWQNKMICQLYYSDKSGDHWEGPVKMNDEINLSNYTTTQPAIGRESRKNYEVIYFVSDRPRGKGGLDIWYTVYNSKRKTYSSPKNAGSKINSTGTEFTPFYDLSTHKLYYSSDGKIGIGGLDVFSSEGEKSKWQLPENLKKDINSPADDIDFTFNKDHQGGFLVSNREGGLALLNPTCCDDIYSFKLTEYINIMLNGRALDSSNCLDGVYELILYINDKETKEKYLSKRMSFDSCNFYLSLEQGHDYTVELRRDGYLTGKKDISTNGIKESTDLTTDIELKKILKEPIALEGILYGFNSSKLTKEAQNSLDTGLIVILQDNPTIIIQINSHTDGKGNVGYNLNLSKKRAESVVRYMVQKGISKNRLKHKGYGESQPIAPNKNPDGSDNPAGRKLNRRTDFTIIGKLDLE